MIPAQDCKVDTVERSWVGWLRQSAGNGRVRTSFASQILPEAHEARIKRPGVVNAWAYPDFKKAVLATGKKNLIMAGVTTDVCLIFPAIDAAKEGFGVQAVMDASGSPSDMSEEFSRQRMRDAGVVLTATNTLMAEIAQDWSTPTGQQLITLLFTDVFPALGASIV